MTQNMYEYLIERLGGPKYYSTRKGTPALFHRHHHVKFNEEHLNKWLDLMGDAIRSIPDIIDEVSCDILLKYFRYTAHTILLYHKESVLLLPQLH